MAKRRPAWSIIREALYLAELWEESLAEANAGCDEEQYQKSKALAKEFRTYRHKRFGELSFETEARLNPPKFVTIPRPSKRNS